MPGIFFSYEFSPIMVKFTEKPRYVYNIFVIESFYFATL